MTIKLAFYLFLIFAAFSSENDNKDLSHHEAKSLLHNLLQELKQKEEGTFEKRVKTAENKLQEAQKSVCVQKKLEQRSYAQNVWQKREETLQKRVKAAEKKLQEVQESVYAQKKSLQELEEHLNKMESSSCERPRKKSNNSDNINISEDEKLKEITNTDKKSGKDARTEFLNLYPNKSSIKVFRDKSNEILWEDPNNLVGTEVKKSIESFLKQEGDAMSNDLFDCLSNYFPPAEGKEFFKELVFTMSEYVGIDRRATHKKTPIMVATCQFDAEKAVLKLIERGANIEAFDEYGTTALHWACIHGNLDIIKAFLQQKGTDVNAQNKNGYTPLMLAVSFERVEVVKILLTYGANIEIKDKYGNTAFTCHKLDAKLWNSRAHKSPRKIVLAKLKN